MVQAIVDMSEQANRTVNVVKALYGFRNKSEALERIFLDHAEPVLVSTLRVFFPEPASGRAFQASCPGRL